MCGSMGRPAKRKVYVEEKARRKAQIQAEVEMQRKKPFDVSIKEHIGKIIDNTKISDIAEVIAAIGFTPMVENIIKMNPDLTGIVKKIFIGEVTWPLAFMGFGGLIPLEAQKKPTESVFTWLLSFSIAYIIVRHAGQLIGLLEKGLTSIVPLLMGVAI